MLRIKKCCFSEKLLQMALLLSLIGYDWLWPCQFSIRSSVPSAEVEVGPLLDHWGDDSNTYGFGLSPQWIHLKNVDRHLDQQWLLNELMSLGRFGDRYPSNIEAYLLNVDGDENGRDDQQQEATGCDQTVKSEPKDENVDEDVVEAFDTDIVEDVFMLAPEVSSIFQFNLRRRRNTPTLSMRYVFELCHSNCSVPLRPN